MDSQAKWKCWIFIWMYILSVNGEDVDFLPSDPVEKIYMDD